MIDQRIKGVIPPMITPFKENGDVDYDKHIANMEHWNEDRLCGYLETIAFTNKAADLGAQAALILTPSYYHAKMNDEAQINFFTHVADNVKIPVLLYNVTAFTHINLSAHTVSTLSRHPNIIGMKDSTGNIPQLVNFLNVMADDFNLMVGTASAWFPALGLGITGGIFALANCAPNECTLVQTAYDEGDYDKARETYVRIFPVNAAVTATFGVAGLKYANRLMGYHGGYVRNPLLPLKKEDEEKIQAILQTADLI
jgi:4-hydroxy-2-oxoglutarate aldolase